MTEARLRTRLDAEGIAAFGSLSELSLQARAIQQEFKCIQQLRMNFLKFTAISTAIF
jgi:hypothetical protein